MIKKQNQDLVALFTEKFNDPNLSKDYTIDDFYDDAGILEADRTDFATAAIIKQMREEKENGST